MPRWNILNKLHEDRKIIDILLENRGILTPEDKEMFLHPPDIEYFIKNLPVEFKKSLKAANTLIMDAIDKQIPVIIHGDYDADGICATAIMYKTLRYELKYERTTAFIPNRFDHGYGLSKGSVDEALARAKAEFGEFDSVLFITVDSGITSVNEADYIKSLGHGLIVTDHHQKPAELPDADCVLWEDSIVGSTISWLLTKVLGSKDPHNLALAAIATVTDVQSLTGFNRSLVKKGLEILNSNPPIGIKKLLDISKKYQGDVTAYDLGWVIGPRLNAAGRLEDAMQSLSLLTEKDTGKIESAANKLHYINQSRQDKTLEMFEVAAGISEADMPKVIISHDEKYHEGIIGLVASRLVQKYYRPSIVMSMEGSHAKGSVRSVSGVDIISILRNFEDMFVNVGGHPMAAGFTIEVEKIEIFKEKFVTYCNETIDEGLLVPTLDIDVEFPGELPSFEDLEDMEKLKPFGVGNNEPRFLSRNMGVTQVNWVGSSKQHLSLRLLKDGNFYKAILFGANENPDNFDIRTGDTVDLVYKLKKDEYNGTEYLNLIVVDLKKSV